MRAPLLVALLAAACGVPAAGPMMSPGEDCVACHAGGDGEPTWTAGGTVFGAPGDPVDAGVMNVRVTLVDDDGRRVTARTSRGGNFYTRERLAFPILVRIEKGAVARTMALPAPRGGCNGCHALPPREDALGRVALTGAETTGSPLMNPGLDCLACHDGRGAPRWSAAGTVFPTRDAAPTQGVEGVTVRFRKGDAVVLELTSNAAGNFFAPDALPFPVRVEIQQGAVARAMDPALEGPTASCNRCHVPGGDGEGRVSVSGEGDD